MSQAYAQEDVHEALIRKIHKLVDYWGTLKSPKRCRERLDGLAFSICSLLDGSQLDMCGFLLVPYPAEEDKEYHIENGEDYYEPAPQEAINADIGLGHLHETYSRLRKTDYPQDESVPPSPDEKLYTLVKRLLQTTEAGVQSWEDLSENGRFRTKLAAHWVEIVSTGHSYSLRVKNTEGRAVLTYTKTQNALEELFQMVRSKVLDLDGLVTTMLNDLMEPQGSLSPYMGLPDLPGGKQKSRL